MRSQINPTYSLGYILALHAASVNLSWAVVIDGEYDGGETIPERGLTIVLLDS